MYTSNLMKQRARDLRKNPSDAENIIWLHLRNRRLQEFKFLRQYPIGPYIVDFICREHNLIIEIDGGQHDEQRTYDNKRTAFLEQQGFRVIRFWNNEVLQHLEGVLSMVVRTLLEMVPHSTPPPPNPLPPGYRWRGYHV